MKLLQVDTVEQAREKLKSLLKAWDWETEKVLLEEAQGRILARDVAAREDIPSFYRSSVDGYAVRSKDTAGASESIPVFLEIVEEVAVGAAASKTVGSGQCSYVPTGGMIPEGADAMVMVEYSELFDESHVAIYDSVSFGRSVVVPGEDAGKGRTLLERGVLLGAPQIGALAAAGIYEAEVFRPMRVSVISTGDELISVTDTPTPGQVRDVNTWALKAMARAAGMEVVMTKRLADDEALFTTTLRRAMELSDLVITSGGSSQGKKDMTGRILDGVSNPGVFTHGLALKPGKPTILGFDEPSRTILAGLPGHPTAAIVVFQLLLAWLWKHITCQSETILTDARMETNLAGAPGKTTCQLVKLIREGDGYIARPILGKSGLITTLAESDGYVLIDMNQEGLKKGEPVSVHRFE